MSDNLNSGSDPYLAPGCLIHSEVKGLMMKFGTGGSKSLMRCVGVNRGS